MGKDEVAKQENLPGIGGTYELKSSTHLIRAAASSPRLAGSCAIMPKVEISIYIQDATVPAALWFLAKG